MFVVLNDQKGKDVAVNTSQVRSVTRWNHKWSIVTYTNGDEVPYDMPFDELVDKINETLKG